jgi:tetratricopeptide (TPR) repeat protein
MAQFREAEVAAREAMAIYSETRGERHLFTAIAAHNLASILAPLNEVDEAEGLYRFSLEAKLESGPANHPGVAQTRSALAGLLVDMGRHAEAETELRKALDVQVPALGRGHWQTGLSLVYLGEVIEDQIGGGAGRALVVEGYEAVKAGLGPDDVETLSAEARLFRMLESEF